MPVLPLFISGAEITFIMFVLVIVFGADKIPEIARGLGKGMRTLKDATNDIKSEISNSAEKHTQGFSETTADIQKEVDDVQKELEEFTGSIKRRP
ncbi:MAG: Sec-independent protein translocase subunit TatA/TatB [Mesonia hippocampi]|uniref:Sec-independent protein translocase protein TatA n=1 Tax=Mesonia hippocampi TaxID=1628250 RepID=A0A840EPS5_9FLAO|nr:twin-arginine translocase TatA/TatE family subunit [Mesonia hippocampi]MBB4118990.1 sec-independent protein translocase protein TatA [Mesonia hippocampi]